MDKAFVGSPLVQERLAFHEGSAEVTGLGDRLLWLGEPFVPGSDLFITSRPADASDGALDWNSSTHTHTVTQAYLLFPDSAGFVAEVRLGDDIREVVAPATIAIPAGVPHALRITKGKGTIVSIIRKGTYP